MDKIMEFDNQPAPLQNERTASWLLVIKDMEGRNAFGVAKYGTPLQAFNGRDSLKDAYEEVLDLCVYLRNEIEERDEKARKLNAADGPPWDSGSGSRLVGE